MSSSFLAATLRLRSAIRRHHPPQRAVLSQICCFGERRWCCFRSCWTVLCHMMRGRPSCLLQSAGGEANRILLASVLSSMRIICPNRISRRDWINAVDQIQMCIVLLIVLHSLVTPVLCVTCKLPATLITKQV